MVQFSTALRRSSQEALEMIRTYVRPNTLAEALDLLADPDAGVLAGGTDLNGDAVGAPSVVVDLQSLGLDAIVSDGALLRIGATATIQALADVESGPPLLRDLAVREAPNTIRNAATVGGTIGSSDPESELLAGLLLFDAAVTLAGTEATTDVALGDILDDPELLAESIITHVTVSTDGTGASERTGRTPKDRPIVMVAGRMTTDGSIHLVATGVAANPTRIDADALDELDPPGDFRGSPEYRTHLAEVLTKRVIGRLEGGRT